MHPSRPFLGLLPLLALGALTACGNSSSGGSTSPADPSQPELHDNGFESDDPTGASAQSAGGSADAGTAAVGASDSNGSATRAVEEADIIKVDGTRLYALSRYGGLSVIDVSDPDHLHLLGRKRTDGMPFEMYVRNGRAYVMMNDFGHYVGGDVVMGGGQWVESSEILALDVTTPTAITEVARYDVPGSIADSRVVGDALYLVTYENGYCWNCQNTPSTIVTSFNVAGSAIAKVDTLSLNPNSQSYSWQRSVSATDQRLYIAGPEYNWQPGMAGGKSIIQVVDIADPGGHLVKGADVSVEGQINSRWQMDEYQGVLRVVSQFDNGWNPNASGPVNPKVQTFTVTNSSTITPLGAIDLVLPHPEQLQSVRFDGARGYAISSQKTDPLYTIDLSVPAQPRQAAALQMPGTIFYMEPRGDRLIGFGYDDTNRSAARLAVSMFDVTSLDTPSLMSRVSFGGQWAQVAEDMDRIQKSVQVLDSAGLILVPFASYGSWNGGNCDAPQSGIQLIDYSHDAITLRGVAPQYGMPRRAFLVGPRLLAMSDRTVTSFDIGSHDTPAKKSDLDLSVPAYETVELPNHVAALSSDWWSGEIMLSLAPKSNPDDAAMVGKVSLAALAPSNQYYCETGPSSWTSWYEARLFANGNTVYLTVPVYTYAYDNSTGQSSQGGKVIVAAIDATDPVHPALIGHNEIALTPVTNNYGYYSYYGFWDGWGYYSYYGGSVVGSGEGVVQVGTKLAYLEVENEYIPTGNPSSYTYDVVSHRKLHVADFANPSAPLVEPAIDLGDSLGSSPLNLQNGVVLTSRWIKSPAHPGKVKFYVDRIDMNGSVPSVLSSINTPGSLLLADEPTGRIVTTDYATTRTVTSDWSSCQSALGYRAYWNYQTNECWSVSRSFKLSSVVGDTVGLMQTFDPPSQDIGGVALGEDRIHITHPSRYDYSTCTGTSTCTPTIVDQGGLWSLGGIRAGQLAIVSQLNGDANWPLATYGTKVALYTTGGMAIYDTANPTATLLSNVNLRGWGYTSNVLMTDHRAICSLDEFGLQAVDF